MLSCTLTAAKITYYDNIIACNGSYIRKTWEVFNPLLNKRKRLSSHQTINVERILINNEQSIADAFSQHLVSQSRQRQSLQSRPYFCRQTKKTLFLFPTDPKQISHLTLASNYTAAGIDSIKASEVKQVTQIMSPVFSYISNLVLSTGMFPGALKTAKLTSIFKVRESTLLSNYHYISILVFSKLPEKIIHARRTNYLEKIILLSPKQFDFRAGV